MKPSKRTATLTPSQDGYAVKLFKRCSAQQKTGGFFQLLPPLSTLRLDHLSRDMQRLCRAPLRCAPLGAITGYAIKSRSSESGDGKQGKPNINFRTQACELVFQKLLFERKTSETDGKLRVFREIS